MSDNGTWTENACSLSYANARKTSRQRRYDHLFVLAIGDCPWICKLGPHIPGKLERSTSQPFDMSRYHYSATKALESQWQIRC